MGKKKSRDEILAQYPAYTLSNDDFVDPNPDEPRHNVFRFDVRCAYIGAVFQGGEVTKQQIIDRLRKAICQAIDDTLGTGWDGEPIPGGAHVTPRDPEGRLCWETISFDLS